MTLACSTPTKALEATIEPLTITRADIDLPIRIDGKLDEPIWATLTPHDKMVTVDPDTLEDPSLATRAYFFYNTKGLYVGVWNEQDPETLISRLSSRDQFIRRDGISFTLDPSGNGLYAYWFGLNLGDAMLDGTVVPERQFSRQWDGPWRGATARHDEGWSAELFLPWSMMTMPDTDTDSRQMGYYLSRSVAYLNERWSYPALPQTRSRFLSALQPIIFADVNPKQQLEFFPFSAATYDGSDSRYKAGFDLFWRPSTNLQITTTINPDFGNVESDNVVVNLTSFETFFPEKRAFFLEGQDIFTTTPRAGNRGRPTTLLNTRRIGAPPVSPDIEDAEFESVELNQPSELIGAAKITGQSGQFRYGLLTAAEDDTRLTGSLNSNAISVLQTGRDYGVARLLYEDTTRGGRRALGWIGTLVDHPDINAMVQGLDGHYLSSNGVWTFDGQLLYSDADDVQGHGAFLDAKYSPSRGRKHQLALDYFDDKVDINDLGFLRRNDKLGLRYNYEVDENDIEGLRNRETRYRFVYDQNNDGQMVSSGLVVEQEREFANNHFLKTELKYLPERWDDRNSNGNGDYRVESRWVAGFFGRTDSARELSVGGGVNFQHEALGGRRMAYNLNMDWRPIDKFSLVTRLRYEDRNGWLLHSGDRDFTTFKAENWRPSLEVNLFLSARQQFRMTAQWAGIKAFEDERWQVPVNDGHLVPDRRIPVDALRDFTISRLTFQARYRWELAPLSDLFVVYTRGSNVDSMPDADFQDLLRDSWTDAEVDVLVVKLRYRLGT